MKDRVPGSQPWLWSPGVDLVFLISPAFWSLVVLLLFPSFFEDKTSIPPWVWLFFIVGVDVSHVYSTLYRTYFDPAEFQQRKTLYTLAPLLLWAGGAVLYSLGEMVFWRTLAYFAVWHFIRQQYGFMALYARKEGQILTGFFQNRENRWPRRLDNWMIWTSTGFPILWWHCHMPRNFHWFMEGDFFSIPWEWVSHLGGGIFGAVALLWVLKEGTLWIRFRYFNLPKFLIILGTALTWFSGIIWLNGDLTFTATNVVAHGIPYMGLIWLYQRKRAQESGPGQEAGEGAGGSLRAFWPENQGKEEKNPLPFPRWLKTLGNPFLLPVWFTLLFGIGYLEEGLWDGWVWKEHGTLFPWAIAFPHLQDPILLSIVVPLLSLPQVTHYLLDGFIWKRKK